MRNSIFFVLVVASLESGCGAKLPSVKPFKLDIQQGNVVTSKMLLQLRPGMTRSQVRYIMGTPLIVDSFRDNRWDYFYELRKQGVVVEKRRVILDFDKDSLVSVRGDVIAAGDNPDVKTIAETPKTETAAADQAWTDKLKFWKDGAAENAAQPEAKAATSDSSAGKVSAATPVVAAAEPAQKNTAQAAPAVKSAEEKAANDDNEVVPYIPEGDYSAALAPSPDDMVKGNMAEANQPPEPAQARQVTEKGVAPKAESAAASTPVFEQEAMPAPQVSAEPEPVLPPPAKPAVVTAPKAITKPVEAKAAVAATAVAAVAAAKPKESSRAAVAAKTPAQPATVKQVEKPAVAPVVNSAMEDDEVIPFIPEGEYAEPVIPTQEEMVKGNMASSNTAAEDAATHAVTEKGVAAPASAESTEPPPTFVAEQMPEPEAEPEPELPPPPALKPKAANVVPAPASTPAPSSTPAPVVAPAVAAIVPEAKSEVPPEAKPAPVSKPMTPALKPMAPAVAALPAQEEAAKDAPVGDADINKAVAAWAQAWRGKNVNAYLAAYAPDFVPEGLPSRNVWEAQRKQRLSAKQGPITLVLNNLQVERDGNSAVVQFEQKYAAKAYKDELLKTLELRYEPTQKRWLITRERVTPLAVSAPAVAAAQVNEPVSVPATVAEQSAPAATPEVGVAAVSVESAVQAWAQAWRSKNISSYLAAYAPDFVPEGLPSKRAWEAQRKQRLSAKQGPITLDISDIDVQQNGDEATVTFTQKYASKAYRDEMQKKLQLRYSASQNAWLIVRETASTAPTSPAAKRDVTAPEGSAEHLDGVLEQIGF